MTRSEAWVKCDWEGVVGRAHPRCVCRGKYPGDTRHIDRVDLGRFLEVSQNAGNDWRSYVGNTISSDPG